MEVEDVRVTNPTAEILPVSATRVGGLHLLDRTDPLRPKAEALIRSVYGRTYDAAPTAFAPLIIADIAGDNRIRAACGIRLAEDTFFSGQYLDEPVAAAVSRIAGRQVDESEIIEITTLASDSNRLGLALLGDVIRLAWTFGISFGCSTTTPVLAGALSRAGLLVNRVADACADKVPNAEQWGAYYAHNPGVYVFDDRARIARAGAEIDPAIEALHDTLKVRRPHLTVGNTTFQHSTWRGR